jgi:hypothetical protein
VRPGVKTPVMPKKKKKNRKNKNISGNKSTALSNTFRIGTILKVFITFR